MQLSNAPAKIVEAFAVNGNKNVIPVPSQIPITVGAASYHDGFPPANAVDPAMGGVGPSILDMNGILSEATAIDWWASAGAGFPYDATFSSAVGGYPKGAKVLRADGLGYWFSTADNNTTDPDTGGAGWAAIGSVGPTCVYASGQQTLSVGTAKVLFDTVEYDPSGLWDATNKRFLANSTGRYRISGAIYLPAPSGQNLATQVWKNGALSKNCFQFPQTSNVDLTLPFDALIAAAIGDYIDVRVVVTQTNVLAGYTTTNEAFVYMQGEFVG